MILCGVVIWYNPREQELNNINSYIHKLDKLYIVDNSINNNKHLLSKIKNNYNNIEYISNGDNLGIAKALNIGCTNAMKEGYEWILTMDQDSEFEENMIEKYICNIENMRKKDNTIVIFAPIIGEGRNENIAYVNKVITSGNILNLKAYGIVNGFDDDLFIDEVDHDFCFKLIEKGYKIYKFEDIRLKHKLGDSKRVKIFNRYFTTMNHNYIRKYYIVRNRCEIRKRFPKYTADYSKSNKIDFIKVIVGEPDKLIKIRYMIKGYIDYKKNKLGKINI